MEGTGICSQSHPISSQGITTVDERRKATLLAGFGNLEIVIKFNHWKLTGTYSRFETLPPGTSGWFGDQVMLLNERYWWDPEATRWERTWEPYSIHLFVFTNRLMLYSCCAFVCSWYECKVAPVPLKSERNLQVYLRNISTPCKGESVTEHTHTLSDELQYTASLCLTFVYCLMCPFFHSKHFSSTIIWSNFRTEDM